MGAGAIFHELSGTGPVKERVKGIAETGIPTASPGPVWEAAVLADGMGGSEPGGRQHKESLIYLHIYTHLLGAARGPWGGRRGGGSRPGAGARGGPVRLGALQR